MNLQAGDLVRLGRSKAAWRVQAVQVRRSGLLLLVYGPIGSPRAAGGRAVWIGSRPLVVQTGLGRRLRLPPVQCRPASSAQRQRAARAVKASAGTADGGQTSPASCRQG